MKPAYMQSLLFSCLVHTHWFATSAIHAEVIIGRRMRHHFTKISSHSFQMGGALHINVSLNPPIFAMKRLFWYASHILYCNGCGFIGRETSLLIKPARIISYIQQLPENMRNFQHHNLKNQYLKISIANPAWL